MIRIAFLESFALGPIVKRMLLPCQPEVKRNRTSPEPGVT